ncbi:beta-ketoacyl-[acyl-carrier-protein] synthase family protein [Pseudonocardia sp. HH130630-07]|uniref:beta-ketoacyl-[acyl-carrier-protein] synthase family protein n=1 Tax=Pseudonocardia sp. HH130630-07 TaxID=1690815 RepID=UPI0008151DCC|nr:beta-ketoacyl-[acyl-carrier-protein] synthase family protein [Pseudonocardia sp. HH130630-07]ANY10845.1 beta-ACP synthase [Pseudonocardia sp. HH130630-07]
MDRRVVVTGLDVLAPGSQDTAGFWDMIVDGRTATRRVTAFDASAFRSKVAAEIDFDATARGFSSRERQRMDRASLFAVTCARGAVASAGLDLGGDLGGATGISIGTAVGCSTSLEQDYLVLSDTGREWLVDPSYLPPHVFDHFSPGSIVREVAGATGARGPATIVSTGCTSGIDAVGHARALVADGTVDVMVAGATEAPITPVAAASFDVIRATTPRTEDFGSASRPFDRDRDGFALGEGAAMLVLEEYEHARRRGATVLAEIVGYANRCNAYHMTGLAPGGEEMSMAIDSALTQARLDPSAIDYINAHGSGTKQNDRHETGAFKRSFGHHAYDIPVSSIKSMIGHSLGAIGSIEIAACVLAMRDDVVPPTANLTTPDPDCDLDYVPRQSRDARLDRVLTVGSGFGGFQSAMVLARGGLR